MVSKLTVNGEVWDPEDWSFDIDKFGCKCSRLVRSDDTSCNGEVTVKPRMPESASITVTVSEIHGIEHTSSAYVSTPTWRYPAFVFLELGRTRRLGLSTCVATIERPAPGCHLEGRENATRETWFLKWRCQRFEQPHEIVTHLV